MQIGDVCATINCLHPFSLSLWIYSSEHKALFFRFYEQQRSWVLVSSCLYTFFTLIGLGLLQCSIGDEAEERTISRPRDVFITIMVMDKPCNRTVVAGSLRRQDNRIPRDSHPRAIRRNHLGMLCHLLHHDGNTAARRNLDDAVRSPCHPWV